MEIIGTGLSGLVGSRITELLSPVYTFEDLSKDTGIDVLDFPTVNRRIKASPSAWVFHLAAYTDVQGAEKERHLGQKSIAWQVNVAATENLVDVCGETGKKLLYVDTDYAFDGSKDFYTEEDAPRPLGWYAVTKSEGAKRVLTLGPKALVTRIANPYRANTVGKKDFVHKMLERLADGHEIAGAADQTFVPTFVDDIAEALDALVRAEASGIYHVVGSTALSPFEAGKRVARVFGYDEELVKSVAFAEFFRDRAPIPQHAALKNDKIRALGVQMKTFEEGLQEVKRQEERD